MDIVESYSQNQKAVESFMSRLECWRQGDDTAFAELIIQEYEALCKHAKHLIDKENRHCQFTCTELVHETYLKLLREQNRQWQNKAHFFGIAIKIMQHILTGRAKAMKRGGRFIHLSLETCREVTAAHSDAWPPLQQALAALGRQNPGKKAAIELVVFAGMTLNEIGHTLDISKATMKRDLCSARQWIRHYFQAENFHANESLNFNLATKK